MTETTACLALPLLQPGQAQKEMTHNEALALIDLAVQPAVAATGLDVPPAGPAPGQAWIVGSAPTADWAGHAGALAGWTEGGWRFVAPFDGLAVWSRADACLARYRAGAWAVGEARVRRVLVDGLPVLGSRQAPIGDPAGGATVDPEARAAVAAILAALRGHGLIGTA